MSTEHVLVGDRVPARSEWQAAIDKLGLPVELDPGLDPGRLAGDSACRLRGEASRLELRRPPSSSRPSRAHQGRPAKRREGDDAPLG